MQNFSKEIDKKATEIIITEEAEQKLFREA